ANLGDDRMRLDVHGGLCLVAAVAERASNLGCRADQVHREPGSAERPGYRAALALMQDEDQLRPPLFLVNQGPRVRGKSQRHQPENDPWGEFKPAAYFILDQPRNGCE